MKFSIVTVGAFAAGTAFALPINSANPAGAQEYVINVSSADGAISGAISQKNGKLGIFPGMPPAKFYTTTYEPAKTLAFHIGDDANQVILVGSNGLLDIDDQTNPSTNTIPKGKLAEWSTFTIAQNGALGVKDGSDIPSRRWIAYPSDGGYIISLYDGYTANDKKMTNVRVSAQDASAAPRVAPVPAPAPAPAPVPTPQPAPVAPAPAPVAPAPKQQVQPRPAAPAPRPQQPAQQGSPYPRVGAPAQQQGSSYPRVQTPPKSGLQPYQSTFGNAPPAGQYQPYNPAQQPWTAPAPPAAPLYPSPDGPSGSSGPSPSAGGAVAPPSAPAAATPAPATNWWDPFGIFGSKPATPAAGAAPSNNDNNYSPAAAAPLTPAPAPAAANPVGGFLSGLGNLFGLGGSSDKDDAPEVPEAPEVDSDNKTKQ